MMERVFNFLLWDMEDFKNVIWKGCVKCKFSFILVFQMFVVTRPNLSILIWSYNFSHKESLERIKKSSWCNAITTIITCQIVIKIQELQEFVTLQAQMQSLYYLMYAKKHFMGHVDEIVQKIHKLIYFESNHCANNVIQTWQEFLQASHHYFHNERQWL
jgi:hypothetical protein